MTMDPNTELVRVNDLDVGLGRTHITSQGQIELPEGSPDNSSGSNNFDAVQPDGQSSTHNILQKVRQKKRNVSIKIKEKLHVGKPLDDAEKLEQGSMVLADTGNAEQSNSRLDGKSTAPEKHTMKEVLHHPLDKAKHIGRNQVNQELAENIAVSEMPHGEDVDLVRTAASVSKARTEGEKLQAEQNLAEMLRERQSTYVRWSLDRHVTKIRVLPRDTITLKPISEFKCKDANGNIKIDWRSYGSHLLEFSCQKYGGQYIGYGSDPPAPSKETIMPNIERLIVATSPFQEFIMTTRRVYRWENPRETSKYLIVYIVLWYLNLLLPGILSAILYLVLHRRWHSQTMEDLREDIRHREDVERTALSLTEFIEKQGNENWAEDLLQHIGPWLMVQLADLANFFESVRNFYEWRKPTRTLAVLVVCSIAILGITMTPQWLLVKTSSFFAGFTFFCLFPISANFPQYRLLVSPTKRLFWNIPTHAEWAIQYIQAEGLRVLSKYQQVEQDETPIANAVESDSRDFASYPAHYNKIAGHLIVSATGVRFLSKHLPQEVLFSIPYKRIHNLEKQDRHVEKVAKVLKECSKDLKIVDWDGRERLLQGMEKRDEVFSQIVGFSRTTWQVAW